MRISVKKLFTLENREDPGEIYWGDKLFSNPWIMEPQCRRGVLTNLGLDMFHCICDYCRSQSAPTHLRRGIRGKVRVLQKVPGQCQPGILGFGAPTPLVTLKIMAGCQGKGDRIATLKVTPDTGATCEVIKEKIAKQIGAIIEPNTEKYKLTDAQNVNIKIVGTCKLRLQRPGGEWKTITAMVTESLSDAVLLSWSTQKFLGILPRSWPHELHVRSVGVSVGPRKLCVAPDPIRIQTPTWPPPHFSQDMRDLCLRYEDVLVEEIPPGRRMYCPEMDIRMKPEYTPFICKKPHPTPLHWKPHIDREIEKLLREGTIQKAHGQEVTFCSPAHWVPKDKNETRFRLVTDLRKLNDSVIPETSTFPTAAKVMSQVKASSKWFICVDTTA